MDPITHTDGIINTVGAQRFVGSNLAIFAQPVPELSSFALLVVSTMALWRLVCSDAGSERSFG